MPTDIPLRCACGTIVGTAVAASAKAGNRVICYCNDCQAFVRFLGRPDIMDEHGGTDIFQMAPGRLQITAGRQALRCVRLSDRGLHRWYCGECKTPIGNTLGSRVPFVGVVHSFMDHAGDGRARAQALGEPLCAVNHATATGTVPRRGRRTSARRCEPRRDALTADHDRAPYSTLADGCGVVWRRVTLRVQATR